MKKDEAIKYIEDKLGYVPYGKIIFDIFDDEEEIPQHFIDEWAKPIPQSNNYILTGEKGAKIFNDIIDKYDEKS